ASAMACTWRVFCPEQSRKKSVNAGVCRRSSTTTSSAFLSSAARTAFAISPVSFFVAVEGRRLAVLRVLAMQLICRPVHRSLGNGGIQPVLEDVCFDERRDEAGDRLRAPQPIAHESGGNLWRPRLEQEDHRSRAGRYR